MSTLSKLKGCRAHELSSIVSKLSTFDGKSILELGHIRISCFVEYFLALYLADLSIEWCLRRRTAEVTKRDANLSASGHQHAAFRYVKRTGVDREV